MAHFAKLDDNNIVLSVHVVNNDVITIDGNESEQAGIDFLTSLHGHNNWKQTSYTGSIRKNFAGMGFNYDSSKDAFIAPKEYESWIFNEETCKWEPPIPCPSDGKKYAWLESNQEWIEITDPQV